ncbi:MAG TPA: ATP synthase subunit C [Longilinea sp.]|nr:ATP synthase subunit C [Longilinea sp.]
MILIIAIFASLIPLVPAVIYFVINSRKNLSQSTKRLIFGLNGFNALLGLMAIGVVAVWLFSPSTVMAAGLQQAASATADPYASLAAAISTGLACVGAGIATANTGAATIGAISEKPELFGRAMIFVGLSEGIVLYGMVISFLVLNR